MVALPTAPKRSHSKKPAATVALTPEQVRSWARWDALLADRDQKLSGKEAELVAKVESWQQLVEALAEQEQPPATPEPQGRGQGGPEQEAAQAGIWSPEFAAWRAAHVAPSSRGLFQQ